ncbi:hypothetical protein [Paenibacillus sp. y28]|uniref:hypothetical protein n=1 Tax=Paenibacillus sp. y28 TaxID=3129110 RepID=UPI003018887E
MSVKLPVSYPLITSYPSLADFLSIAASHPDYEAWLNSNMIQLFCVKKFGKGCELKFYFPYLFNQCALMNGAALPRHTMALLEPDPVEMFIKCIDGGNYVIISADSYHISAYKPYYQKQIRPHFMMVFGYDRENGTFDIADFFVGRYEYTTTTFEELRAAYEAIPWDTDRVQVKLLKLEPRVRYEFDKQHVYDLLSEYFHGFNTSRRYGSNYNPSQHLVYGMDIYPKLQEFIPLVGEGICIPDRRPFHVIYDHKRGMKQRIEYMVEHGHIPSSCLPLSQQYADMTDKCQMMRNLILKYEVVRQPDMLLRISDYVKQLEQEEREVLKELLSALNPASHDTASV